MAFGQVLSGAIAAPEATYGFTASDSPRAADIEVAAVTAHRWRISDVRLPAHDPFRLLAVVEVRGDVVEVMRLGAGSERHEVDSLDAAVALVLESASRLAQQRLRDELSWAA